MILVVYAGTKRTLALLRTGRQKLYRFIGNDEILNYAYYLIHVQSTFNKECLVYL